MENIVKAFFTEVLNNEALQSQLDPIWNRYEDAEDIYEAVEPLNQVIGLAGMHGFAFTAADLDNVLNEALAKDFVAVQKGEIELSDADLDLIAGAGKRPPTPNCQWLKRMNPEKYKRYCT